MIRNYYLGLDDESRREITDTITLVLKVRERTVKSWLLGYRNPKPYVQEIISKLTKISQEKLFKK